MTQNKKFWIDFWIIFVLGGIIIGLLEVFSYDVVYPFMEQHKLPQSFPIKLLILYEPTQNFICLGYAIYSFNILYKDIDIVKYKKLLKTFLGMYYVLFVFVLSWFHYCSPFAFACSNIYTGTKYDTFQYDVRNYIPIQHQENNNV